MPKVAKEKLSEAQCHFIVFEAYGQKFCIPTEYADSIKSPLGKIIPLPGATSDVEGCASSGASLTPFLNVSCLWKDRESHNIPGGHGLILREGARAIGIRLPSPPRYLAIPEASTVSDYEKGGELVEDAVVGVIDYEDGINLLDIDWLIQIEVLN